MNKLQSIKRSALIIAIPLAIALSLGLIFFLGIEAAKLLTPFLLYLAGFIFITNIIALLVAGSPKFKAISGLTLLVSSYIYGIILWTYGLVVTMSLWGILALIIGLLLGGVGVVPIGLLAALFNGEWGMLLTLISLGFTTYATRVIGSLLLVATPLQAARTGKGRPGKRKVHNQREVIDLEPEDVEYKKD